MKKNEFKCCTVAALIMAAGTLFGADANLSDRGTATIAEGATTVLNVVPDKPLRYEKCNGRLEVRSLITLSTVPEGSVSRPRTTAWSSLPSASRP